ncbi:MAG: hypothetical protein WDZ41_05480 [Candidatus Babeliales bacterium]
MNKYRSFLILFILIISTNILSIDTSNETTTARLSLLRAMQQEAAAVVWEANLSPEQLQILLNFTCVTYALINTEHQLQEEGKFIAHMGLQCRYNNDQLLENVDHFSMFERSIDRFRNLLKAKHILGQAYLDLDDVIQNSENNRLLTVIDIIAQHASHLINYIAKQEDKSINQLLNKSIALFKPTQSSIAMTGGTYQALIDNSYPFDDSTKTEVQKITLAQSLAQTTLIENVQKLLTVVDSVSTVMQQMQEFGSLIFYIYYKTIYDGMQERAIDIEYFVPLFEDNCVVALDPTTKILKDPFTDNNLPFFERSER